MTNAYHFVSRWRVKASAWEVYDIISQPLEYPRWWPSVYLESRETLVGEPDGTRRRVRFRTTGLIPYTLNWEASVTETVPPHRIVFAATGDFSGRGTWSFVEDGDFVDITFEWNIAMVRNLLRYLAPVLHPAFEVNHRWAMQQGEISLREELKRYRARTPRDLLDAAEPRGPVEVPVRWLALSALAISAVACIALMRRRSRKSQPASA